MRSMITPLALTILMLSACGGGGVPPAVLGAPPPPGLPGDPPSDPIPPDDPPPQEYAAKVGGITLFGGSGGQAPHAVHVHANIDGAGVTWKTGVTHAVGDRIESSDGSTLYTCTVAHTSGAPTEPGLGAVWGDVWAVYSETGSGFWPEGRWQYQFQRADGSSLASADRDWMRVEDPLSGQLVYTDDRFSASPTAAFVFRSPGTYRVRLRYQNRDKDWSDWVVSPPIPVASNARTKIYVDGAIGNDANDGLSPMTAGGHGPKATLDAALRSLTSNDYEVVLADDTTCQCVASENTSARSGIWIHRSGSGASKPKVVLAQAGHAVFLGNDSIVEGLEFVYDGSSLGYAATWGINKTNVAILDCDYNECASVVESGSDRQPSGVLLLRLRALKKVARYCTYIDHARCVSILGCAFEFGSESEHVVRIGSPSTYVSVELSTLDYASDDTGKSCFRCYADHVGVHRSLLARGTVSLGNIDVDESAYRDYCIDGCELQFDGTSLACVYLWENVGRVVIRTTLIRKAMTLQNSVISIEDNAQGGNTTFSGLRLYNVTVQNTGTGNNSGVLGQGMLTQPATDVLVRGMLMVHSESDEWTWGSRFGLLSGLAPENTPESGLAGSWRFEDNVHSVPVANEFRTASAYYSVEEANLQPWADGLIVEEHTLSVAGEPLGTGVLWKSAVRTTTGVFRSLNGLDWIDAGPAGAWRPVGE